MKTLILNGNPAGKEEILPNRVKDLVLEELKKKDWPVTIFDLNSMDINPCLGCFKCWVKTPGRCIIKDDQEKILKSIVGSEMLILFTPLTFGGYSSELKKMLDRTIPILLPFFTIINGEVHHLQRYKQRRHLVVIATLEQSHVEMEKIFHNLVKRNALNMAAPQSISLVLYEQNDVGVLRRQISEVFLQEEVA